jgi:arginase family enzyme
LGIPFDSKKPEIYSKEAPDRIRQELYYLAKPQKKLNIADFGNLRASRSIKGNYKALRDIIEYFNELNIPAIIIGGSQDLSYGICEAFKTNRLFTYSTIDATLDVKRSKESFGSKNYLSRIFASNPNIFQFSLIGYQSHYFAAEYFSKTKGINQHVRLGQLREDILLAEPILRNTDVLSFDIGAIKYSDAPGGNFLNPNGLRSEEACQLAKYAGLSERLKVFGLFGVDTKKDQFNLIIKLSAQIIWYFIDGFSNRKSLKDSFEENKIVYQVDVKGASKPLVFFKNKETNQWCMQLQAYNNKKIVLGCQEKEYLQASNNDIPEMWLRYIQKIDELLK